MFFVYVLKSDMNDEIYISSTNDLSRRVDEHNNGRNISTKRYLPWRVIYYEAYLTEELARMREKSLKYHGNAMRELKKRIKLKGSPSTTFTLGTKAQPKDQGGSTSVSRRYGFYGKSGAGFTIIELLVSISIFFIVTGFVLSSYPRFGSNLAIESLAQDIALTIRQAQVFGSAILGTTQRGHGSETVPAQIFNAYGVSFPAITTRAPGEDAVDYTYTIFADIPGGKDNSYDKDFSGECGSPDSTNECVTNFVVNSRRYGIEKFCKNFYRVDFGRGTKERIEDGCTAGNELSTLDILFIRPHLEAIFNATNIFSIKQPPSTISNVAIIISSSDKSIKRAIVVWKTGQISIEKSINISNENN